MILKNRIELLDVLGLQKVFQDLGRKLRKGLVGGREDGERASSRKCVDELSGFEGRDERGKVWD